MTLFFKLMVPIGSSIFLKNHVSCSFVLKYYITNSLRQFAKNWNHFFDKCRANKNLEICAPVRFVQLNVSKQFWRNFIGHCFNKWTLSQKYRLTFSLKTALCKNMIFMWLSLLMKLLLEKLYFEFPHTINFSCTWHKEASNSR